MTAKACELDGILVRDRDSAKARAAVQRRIAAVEQQEAKLLGQIFSHPLSSLRDVLTLLWFMEDQCSDTLHNDTGLSASFYSVQNAVAKLAADERKS